jgi:hypothetical protein
MWYALSDNPLVIVLGSGLQVDAAMIRCAAD